MMKIGITGSLASGKTTASKIISNKKGPLFSADEIVKKLYTNKSFKKKIINIFNLKKKKNIKIDIKKKIYEKKENLKKLESLIHPLVRKEMHKFIKRNKKKKFIFFEIPLLVESKLTKNFDVTIFIRSRKSLRLRRYRLKGGSSNFFKLLNSTQLQDKKKMKFCDHIVVNNKSLNILKNRLFNIMKRYE